eukprot:4094403-Amphidinium_carterae.1
MPASTSGLLELQRFVMYGTELAGTLPEGRWQKQDQIGKRADTNAKRQIKPQRCGQICCQTFGPVPWLGNTFLSIFPH